MNNIMNTTKTNTNEPMKKLWEVNYTQDKMIEAYCFGADSALDTKLIKHDVLGSIAHAKMLHAIKILSNDEYKKLKSFLLDILYSAERGKFTVEPTDEDVHTKIETVLIHELGDLGKKIHTGRSRNDQVLVDLRLYAKEKQFHTATKGMELVNAFHTFANLYEFVPMPGYTHMQKAMPSSVGLWAASFAESLIDDLQLLEAAYHLNNQSPLGSAAAYGASLPLDREMVAKDLGFAKVQNNVLYSQVSRGKIQLATMHALSQIMLTLSRFAQDMLLFTTSEFDYFNVSEKFCTGSSIMPQKKNLDVMEILRAKTHVVISQEHLVSSIIAGLPSGYNADFGQTKQPFMSALETVIASLEVVTLFVKELAPNVKKLTEACTPELFATHAAYMLVKEGKTFRDAHHIIAKSLDTLPKFDTIKILKETNHTGGPGNLQLAKISKVVKIKQEFWLKENRSYIQAIKKLKGEIVN